MKIYKVVPYEGQIVASSEAQASVRIAQVADRLNFEEKDGWRFIAVMPMTVLSKPSGGMSVPYNGLIFSKDI